MPMPDAIIVGAQDKLIGDRVGADFEAKDGKNGTKVKGKVNRSTSHISEQHGCCRLRKA
jgi:hypothetical protein